MAFDSKLFNEVATRLIDEPRQKRTVDVLIENQAVVKDMLTAGLDYRAIHTALTEAGWKVSYAAVAKAMTAFLQLANLPTSRHAGVKQQRQRAALTPSARLPATPLVLVGVQGQGKRPVAGLGESALETARRRLRE